MLFIFLETGGLFMLAIRLMQLFSESSNDFTKLTGILGLYFQIRDDYCNLCLQEVGHIDWNYFIFIICSVPYVLFILFVSVYNTVGVI